MLLPVTRQEGTLLRRYKRFLADILLDDGREITVHCPNSGAMLGCSEPGSRVVLSHSGNPGRKYAWTLEMLTLPGQHFWIGLHTGRTNHLVREGLETGAVDAFGKILGIRQEVKISGHTRLDFLLDTAQGPVYLEVKHCSLAENGVALFPDAVTVRGAKHMRELARLAEEGQRAALLFCVQRADAERCSVAWRIDPEYGRAVAEAQRAGVAVYAWQTKISPERLEMAGQLPFQLEL